MREINFDHEAEEGTPTGKGSGTSKKSHPKNSDSTDADDAKVVNGNTRAGRRHKGGGGARAGGKMQMSDAEELLKRLKEL